MIDCDSPEEGATVERRSVLMSSVEEEVQQLRAAVESLQSRVSLRVPMRQAVLAVNAGTLLMCGEWSGVRALGGVGDGTMHSLPLPGDLAF